MERRAGPGMAAMNHERHNSHVSELFINRRRRTRRTNGRKNGAKIIRKTESDRVRVFGEMWSPAADRFISWERCPAVVWFGLSPLGGAAVGLTTLRHPSTYRIANQRRMCGSGGAKKPHQLTWSSRNEGAEVASGILSQFAAHFLVYQCVELT